MLKTPTKLQQLEQIVVRHQERLFRFAFLRTGSRPEAEDIVQEVLLRLFRSSQDLMHIEDVERYLMRAIANRCFDYHRQRTVTKVDIDLVKQLPQQSDDPDTQEVLRIASLLESLPPEQAEVIRMKTSDNLTFRQIAEMTNLPQATVKSRFRYGLARLRQFINH